MNLRPRAGAVIDDRWRDFLAAATWHDATGEPLTGDASARQYVRLRQGERTAMLMDASQNLESVRPFIQIGEHLQQLGFSVPTLLARDEAKGWLLLEDLGDDTFARLLASPPPGEAAPGNCEFRENPCAAETLFALATDVLVALHKHSQAIPKGLRAYHPEKMLEDIELFLEWRTPAISEAGKAEFRTVWREVLPLAHQVPASLLLRDYQAANLMWLPERTGIRRAGLLDFQDAYQGPITYDLMSLLEDARREVSESLKENMTARYLAQFPALDCAAFAVSLAVVAAQRHTRVLAIFERLSQREGKHDYRRLHSPRVERRLRKALNHPMLAGVKQWMQRYAWPD